MHIFVSQHHTRAPGSRGKTKTGGSLKPVKPEAKTGPPGKVVLSGPVIEAAGGEKLHPYEKLHY